MAEARERTDISVIDYELFVTPESKIITPLDIFWCMVKKYVREGLAKEGELDPLSKFVPQNRQLFLPVPLRPDDIDDPKGLDELIRKLRHQGREGVNENYEPECFLDIIEAPKCPYIALCVDDGRNTLGLSHNTALAQLKDESPFIWWEGFCLCLVLPVLVSHEISCAGSTYDGEVPSFLLKDCVPSFVSHPVKGRLVPNRGFPYCKERVTI